MKKVLNLLIIFLLTCSTFGIFTPQSKATISGDLQILKPENGFTVSGAFNVTFKITNTGSEELVFAEGDASNRLDLEVEFDFGGVVLWSTNVKGFTLPPGESFTKTVKCEVGVYEGNVTISLIHWKKYDSEFEVGLLGKSKVNGRVVRLPKTGSPVIGFYGWNALYAELADYLQNLGYLVRYVNRSSFMSVDAVYLDYRCSPPEEELLSYVNNGGNIWITGEASNSERNFLGVTISKESVEFWGSKDDPTRLWMRGHPLTTGISLITYPSGAYLKTSGDVEDIIRIDGKPILAIDQSHKGKILWIIDSDMFGKYFLYRSDNEILAKNIANWLCEVVYSIPLTFKVIHSITNNYQVEYDKGGLSAALTMIRSAFNYIDATIDVKVSNGEFIKDIEPELAIIKYSKLVVQPTVTWDIKKVGDEEYSIHIQVSGFTSDMLFSLIKASIISKLTSMSVSLTPYEKMLIDNKPAIAVIGFKITDIYGKTHNIHLDEPEQLPYLFNPSPFDGTVVDVMSPVHILIVDTQGHRVGALYDNNGKFISEINEIPGAFYTGLLKEGEFIYLPPSVKNYKIKVFGAEPGNYTLRVLNAENGVGKVETYSGKIKAGSFQEFKPTETGIQLIKPTPWYQQYWSIIAIICIVFIALAYIWYRHKNY